MEKIKVNKTELLSILETNRSKHRQIFEEACDGYQKAVIKELEAQLKRAKEGIRRSTLISIPAPVDQTKEYDLAIAMLKKSVEEEVFLSEQDFRCYDDWDGKQKFLASSRSYSAGAASLLDDMERGVTARSKPAVHRLLCRSIANKLQVSVIKGFEYKEPGGLAPVACSDYSAGVRVQDFY